MQTLSRELILKDAFQASPDVTTPPAALFDAPERILQFGTGAFLRGFIDYFVDRANHEGLYNGRIVAVSSTGSGRAALFNEQNGLYTLVVQGKDHGRTVDSASVISSVSRSLSAQKDWSEILAFAEDPNLEVIVSNTTEVGIRLNRDDGPHAPPESFPGKVAAVLHARARAFDFDPDKALVVLPCELLVGNGDRLRDIVAILAKRWTDRYEFTEWLDACRFCNTLVDRIVPGTPDASKHEALQNRLGWKDNLLTVAEPYRLWAIEGNDGLRERLPFLNADRGIVVAENIEPYRELKVRILNGTHTAMVPAALQFGLETVSEAVTDPVFGRFVRRLMMDEIVPYLEVDARQARSFADDVLDRFDNPFIVHPLKSIMLQATMKTGVRVAPSIQTFIEREGRVPPALTLGFVLLLLIRRGDTPSDFPADDHAHVIEDAWSACTAGDAVDVPRLVHVLLANEELWHADLTTFPGFEAAVVEKLEACLKRGVAGEIEALAASGTTQS